MIVEKNDPDMLAAAINRLLADPGQAAAFGRRGGQRVAERYSWSRIAELTASIYEQALSARQSRRPEAA
jgi:alpha-maltose-1-phosphate synthase